MSSATPPLPHQAIDRRDAVALGALVLVGIGIPLWMAAVAGAVGLPSNDDWVYMRAALSLFDTGSVDMPGHTAAFIGQLALVQPFLWLSGGDPWAFTAFGLVMSAIGIASTYLLARRFVGTGSAVMVVLLVLAFPGFVRESATFMTDGPAYALAMVCLLLGTRWLQDDGGRVTLAASLGAGLLAVSIREFAIAAPLAILIATWARSQAPDRAWLAGLTIILGAGLAGVFAVGASISGRGAPSSRDVGGLIDLGPAFATLAAAVLPAILLYMGQRMARFSAMQILGGAALGCLVIVDPDGPLLGNLWTSDGLAGNQLLAGARDPVIGGTAWALSRQVAVFAAILAAAVALRWGQHHHAGVTSVSTALALSIRIVRSRRGPIVLFLFGYAAELVLYGFVGGLFDRYLFPMIPVAAILLLRGPTRPFQPGRSHAFAHGALAWLVVSAFVITANSFAYDAARYREGEAAVAMGYDATVVDAGYEWVGLHGSGVQQEFDPTGINWWQDIWSSFRPCAVLWNNKPPDALDHRLIRVNPSAYLQFLIFGPAQPLYLYGALLDDCPRPPPAVDAS